MIGWQQFMAGKVAKVLQYQKASYFHNQDHNPYLVAATIVLYIAPPGSHRRNAAKCTIRMFKNNFVSGPFRTDTKFFLHIWDWLLTQALLRLNFLHALCLNPRISSHAQLHGAFVFNKNPTNPPGTCVAMHEKPT